MLTKEFLTQFDNPSAEWRFAPFWFLNHRLQDDELVRQIDEMHQNGFGGFILHARHVGPAGHHHLRGDPWS